MPQRDRYLRKAMECARAVERLHDPAERAELLLIAKGYMKLSHLVARRHDHGTAHRNTAHEPDRHPDDA